MILIEKKKRYKNRRKDIFSNYKGIKEHSFNNNYINNRKKNKIENNNDSKYIKWK